MKGSIWLAVHFQKYWETAGGILNINKLSANAREEEMVSQEYFSTQGSKSSDLSSLVRCEGRKFVSTRTEKHRRFFSLKQLNLRCCLWDSLHLPPSCLPPTRHLLSPPSSRLQELPHRGMSLRIFMATLKMSLGDVVFFSSSCAQEQRP